MNERPRHHNHKYGNDLHNDNGGATAPAQRDSGGDCHGSPPFDPVLLKLIEVWPTLPANIRKAVEALCLPPVP